MFRIVDVGEIYICDFGDNIGSMQGGVRPCIIVDNKINPRFIPNIKEGKENFNLMLMFTFNDVESV